jgi:hypothetical protein
MLHQDKLVGGIAFQLIDGLNVLCVNSLTTARLHDNLEVGIVMEESFRIDVIKSNQFVFVSNSN